MQLKVLTVLAVGLLIGADVPKEEVKKEQEKLQGTWKAATVEEKGQSKEDSEDHRLIFSGSDFTVKRGEQAIIKGTFTLDPSKKPKTLDLKITEVTEHPKHKDKTALAIYELDGDTLKWCVMEPGDTERPREFAAPAGTKHIFVTLKREKP